MIITASGKKSPASLDAFEGQFADNRQLEDSDDFDQSYYRQAILAQVWKRLEAKNPNYYLVLRLKAECPDITSAERAQELSRLQNKTVTDVTARKNARTRS